MITRMTGTLNRVLDEEVRLQIGPLEYQVLVPEFIRRQLQMHTGEVVTLSTPAIYRGESGLQQNDSTLDRLPSRVGTRLL